MTAAEPLTREQILAAAKETLRRYGPAKTTVVDVAQALGVSHGTVYRHFPTKAALRGAVVQQGLGAITERLALIAGERGPAAERMHRWFLELIEYKQGFCREDVELFETYARADKDAPEVVNEHVGQMTGQLARMLAAGVEAGEFHASALGAAGAVWDATARFHHPVHRAEWADPKIGEDFEAVWRLILSGLASPARPAAG
jgi:AcrR family transcriptional regulator